MQHIKINFDEVIADLMAQQGISQPPTIIDKIADDEWLELFQRGE